MPALVPERQPEPLHWFLLSAGAALLEAEMAFIHRRLPPDPRQPWLWISPPAHVPSVPDAKVHPRGLRLYREEGRLLGNVDCRLPLPLPTEAIPCIVLQHVLEDGAQDLLEECARVLEPGGRLWVLSLNPWSPYRLRWRQSGLLARDRQDWNHRLRSVGLTLLPDQTCYLGPVWNPRHAPPTWLAGLQAICVLEAEKRTAALTPIPRRQRAWRAETAHARTPALVDNRQTLNESMPE